MSVEIAVSVRNLHRRYGKRVVIDGLDLTIRTGEFVALRGESGCGKTTFLRALAGLDPIDGGQIDGPSQPAVVVACVEHERHSLPALVIAEGLAWEGYRVTYLGGDPDPDRLVREVVSARPRAVLFSASLTSSLAGQKRVFAEIRSFGIPVVVGGIIPDADAEALRVAGVARVYTPKDFELNRIMLDIVGLVDAPGREAA